MTHTNSLYVLLDFYPIFTTASIEATRAFYLDRLKFTAVFDSTWFVLLETPGGKGRIAFMAANHETQHQEDRAACDPKGLFLTLQVADAAAAYAEAQAAQLPVLRRLHDEPFGQRHFMVSDPNGLKIDIVEQIEPQPGFWDRYLRT